MLRLHCVLSSMKLALLNAPMAKVLLTFGCAGTVATLVVYGRNTRPTIAPDSDWKPTPLMIVLRPTAKAQAIRAIQTARNVRFASSSLTLHPLHECVERGTAGEDLGLDDAFDLRCTAGYFGG